MGNQVGVIGGGHLGEQVLVVADSVTATLGAAIIAPAVQTGAVTSGVIHRKGANMLLTNFNVGAIGSAGLFTGKIQHSADGATGWADLAASTQGFTAAKVTTATGAIGATANTDVQLLTDLRSAYEYVRIYCTLNSGTSVLFGATAVLGGFDTLPATQY